MRVRGTDTAGGTSQGAVALLTQWVNCVGTGQTPRQHDNVMDDVKT